MNNEIKKGCVYAHKNNLTNKYFYIGMSINQERPYSYHGRSDWWHRIVSKYGRTVHILYESSNLQDLYRVERQYIAEYGRMDEETGILCNMTDGGDGTHGYKFTQAQRETLSKAMMGKSTEWLKGRTLSEEHKKNVSNALKGKIPKNIELLSKCRIKPVLQYTKDGALLKIWDSLTDVGSYMQVSIGNISSCCNGNRKSAYGYKWKYKTI